jgi:MFS family permease
MNRLAEALYSIAISLWVGALFAIGYLAAPVLFHELSDRTLAGSLAGAMFTIVAYAGLACGGYLVLYLLFTRGWRAVKSGVFWIVLAMLALTVAGHFGIQPILAQLKADALPRQVMESALHDRFAAWHGVSSGLYLLQSLLGLWLVVWQERGKH